MLIFICFSGSEIELDKPFDLARFSIDILILKKIILHEGFFQNFFMFDNLKNVNLFIDIQLKYCVET